MPERGAPTVSTGCAGFVDPTGSEHSKIAMGTQTFQRGWAMQMRVPPTAAPTSTHQTSQHPLLPHTKLSQGDTPHAQPQHASCEDRTGLNPDRAPSLLESETCVFIPPKHSRSPRAHGDRVLHNSPCWQVK